MSELSVGSLSGLAANSYVIDVASGSQLTQPGMILQVVQAQTSTTTSTSSTSYVDTALTGTITPTSADSKIMVIAMTASLLSNGVTANNFAQQTVFRGDSATGTDLGLANMAEVYQAGTDASSSPATITVLDSPATTSSVTYTVGIRSRYATTSAQAKSHQNMILMEVAG